MMIVERIWGPKALEEIVKPHPDPEIRKMEIEMLDIHMKMIAYAYRKPTYDEIFDLLPACYRKVKI